MTKARRTAKPRDGKPASAELTVQRVARLTESVLPLRFAEPGDIVGHIVGRREMPVRSALLAVDCSPAVVAEAVAQNHQMILAMLPPFRAPLDSLTDRTAEGRLLLEIVGHGLAVFVGHTAWEASPHGLDAMLLDALKCRKLRPLKPSDRPMWAKILVTLPANRLPDLLAAITKAGVAASDVVVVPVRTSAPDSPAFDETADNGAMSDDEAEAIVGEILHGTGAAPPNGSSPDADLDADSDADSDAASDAGEFAGHARVDITVLDENRKTVLTAISSIDAESAVRTDVIALATADKQAGLGRVGELPQRGPIKRLLTEIRRIVKPSQMRTVGDIDGKAKRVAVARAADLEFVHQAVNYGANVLIAGDIGYEAARLAADLGLVVVDVGMAPLIQSALPMLRDKLAAAMPEIAIELAAASADPFV